MKLCKEKFNLGIIFTLISIIGRVKAQELTTESATGGEGESSTDAAEGEGTDGQKPVTTEEYKSLAAWLRICQPGAGKHVGAVTTGKDECPAGYWFKDTLKVGCACGHGVDGILNEKLRSTWLFAKGWCDHTARIIIAHNGSCFNVNKDVKYIRQIGWYHNAFMPYHFVGTTGMEYIQTVPLVMTLSEMATLFHPEYHQHIGAIFRERGVESMTGRFCLSQKGNVSRPLAFKFFVPKLPYFEKRSCFAYTNQDAARFEYDAGYDLKEGLTLVDEFSGPFNKPKTWVVDADSAKCATECPSANALVLSGGRNNSFAPEYVDPMVDEYFLQELKEIGWKPDANNSSPASLPDQKCDREYALSNKTMVELQEQTKRMIRLNIKSSIKNEISPRVKYADYKLLQKARTILDKVCPEAELPSTVLTGMHRMFRIAVNESFFHYPFHQLGDESETEKIRNILSTCFADAKPMTFVYANQTNETSTTTPNPNDSGTPNLKSAKCEKGKFIGVKYEFTTNTSSFNRTIMTKLPCYLWSNITELDLVVETAWKTVMFAHYYCARHFRENSLGFSIFEQKMERFFNRWIQHRWFYPGLSLQGYKYIYQMFNLEEFGKALDRCVAAVRTFSVYRKWIKRPTYSKFMGGKLFEEQYEIPDEIAGRTKLDAINPKLNQFDKKAYCLPYWHAPASNPGLNYNPEYKPGCVKYVKEEWLDPFTPVSNRANGWRGNVDIL